MLTMWSSILIILSLCVTIHAVSLLDFPMEIPNDHLIFHSVLTHVSTSQQWKIVESLAGVSQVHGKIQVTMADTHKFEIFYHANRDDHRLLLTNDSCQLVTYNNNQWSTLLPGVEQPLINMILMLGPSLIYRLDSYSSNWAQEQEMSEDGEEVRGVQVISYSTQIGATLKIIVYFKSDMELDVGLRNPLRLIFEEGKAGSAINPEKVILDIYSLKSTDTKLDKFIEVTPGYGCNLYFQPGRVFPQVTGTQIYVVATDTKFYNDQEIDIQAERITIFADTEMNYLRVEKKSFGSLNEETIYDTDLGIGYTLKSKDSSCKLTPLTNETPGINEKGSFDLKQLFMVQGSVKYVGNMYLPNEFPFPVDYWESTIYNLEERGSKFDKVVTTYYFATKTDEKGDTVYEKLSAPTAIIRKIKAKYTTGMPFSSYLRREIYDFQTSLTEDQYKSAFTLNECINDLELKKTLTLLIEPKDSDGLKFAEKNVIKFRESIKKLITNEISLSPLRIVGIDVSFNEEQIRAFLSITETPKLAHSFLSYDFPVDTDVLTKKVHGYQTEDAEECLHFLASNTEIKSVVYCGLRQFCIGVNDPNMIKEAPQKGVPELCKVFMIPLGNLLHLRKQIPLVDIDSAFQTKIVRRNFELGLGAIADHVYKIQEMVDVSTNSEKIMERQAFNKVKEGAKLNINQPVGLVKSVYAKNYGDCYRSCAQSKQLDCSAFSYCYNSTNKSNECLVSEGLNLTEVHDNAAEIIHDDSCTINKRNLMFNYLKIPAHASMDWVGWVEHMTSIEDCAVKCTQSTNCRSFKYCNSESTCYIPSKGINRMTDQPTNSSKCDYYLLKASNRFKVTGSKIVTDVIQTLNGLNLEQCAAKCFNWWKDEETSSECQSFNFCAKYKSNLCQISGTTVHGQRVNLAESTNCINYEILEPNRMHNRQQQNEHASSKLSKSSVTTTILMLMVGLTLGAGFPFAYKKLKQKYLDHGLPMQRFY